MKNWEQIKNITKNHVHLRFEFVAYLKKQSQFSKGQISVSSY